MKNEFKIAPIKNYSVPDFPNLQNARESSLVKSELKKFPSRWQKKTVILSCVGLIGLAAFAGCTTEYVNDTHHGGAGDPAPFYVTQPTEEETRSRLQTAIEEFASFRERLETGELDIRAHYGGSGAGPFYVATFTEQEAFGFMRAALEAAGLNFSDAPPDSTVQVEGWVSAGGLMHTIFDVGIDFFDAERNVGVAQTGTQGMHQSFSLEDVVNEFAQLNITVAALRNPSETVIDWGELPERWSEDFDEETYNSQRDELIAARTDEARQNLINEMTTQTQNFIDRLQDEGILSRN
jgi:hypothetical protein